MDLVRYVRLIRRGWLVVTVATVLGALVGFVAAPRPEAPPPQPQEIFLARHVLWSTTLPQSRANSEGQVNLNRMAEMIELGPVPEHAARRLGGEPDQLAADVIAFPDPSLAAVEVYARASTPERAAELADGFAKELAAYQDQLVTAELDDRITALNDDLAGLQADLNTAVLLGDEARADALSRSVTTIQAEIESLRGARSAASAFISLEDAQVVGTTIRQVEDVFDTPPPRGRDTRSPIDFLALVEPLPDESFTVPRPIGALAGALFGGGLGAALVIGLASIDPRVYTKEETEQALGFDVIAEIPTFSRKLQKESVIVSRAAPYSRFAEAYRVLRSSILFVERRRAPDDVPSWFDDPDDTAAGRGRDRHGVVVMVTSPGPSEGKTTTVSNLASVLAEDGRRVLVVNCDFRRPRLHNFLGGGEQPRKVFDTIVPGVKLVTGVVADPRLVAPAEVIGEQLRVISGAKRHFDYVLLDTAPLLTTNDASELLPITDMVVMICRSGKTTRESADRASELLERFAAPVIGAVLVGSADSPTRQYYYYYAYPQQPIDTDDAEPSGAELAGDEQPDPSTATPGAAR